MGEGRISFISEFKERKWNIERKKKRKRLNLKKIQKKHDNKKFKKKRFILTKCVKSNRNIIKYKYQKKITTIKEKLLFSLNNNINKKSQKLCLLYEEKCYLKL